MNYTLLQAESCYLLYTQKHQRLMKIGYPSDHMDAIGLCFQVLESEHLDQVHDSAGMKQLCLVARVGDTRWVQKFELFGHKY